jgi:hypothetical protein
MTSSEFNLIARLLKSKEPTISAVRLVLLKGVANAEAARIAGCTPQSAHRSAKRFMALHADIRAAFKS